MNGNAPVDMVLVEFPGNRFTGDILAELERLVDSDTIRIVDVLLVSKNADGSVNWLAGDDAGDGRLAALVGDADELLAEDDALAVAEELAPDSSVGMLLFEHTWAAGLAGAIRGADGRLLDWARVPAAAIDELARTAHEEG